ncbi:VanY-A/VanY-F/VanY-M family D-Ala-D-Ala carboxypeptidase [Neobacillus jeddahensis]|uniref:VanY-A/VanY-F/VanY-M family D-Ala-D-Ala carboxypeptidase n=1 Tax=Neobacillus jeddahensis TaxID=1461580 RepID=UPI0005911070|nr:VanY-A/VanY-F/VanY-M family D-Ala-D-Ala carboxypeptidase [Neobacillus jeddahensis]
MKKWGFLLLCIVGLAYVVVNKASFFQEKVKIQSYDQTAKKNFEDIGTSATIQNTGISREQVFQGNLLLVNQEYPVHQESIKSDVVNLFEHKELTAGFSLLESDIYLSRDIAEKFSDMIAGAKEAGVTHFSINSGFRAFDEQDQLYQEMGPDYSLPAGFSEHNLGLSLDVGSTLMKMNQAPEGKWIEKNAWAYGFILRYPQDKTAITGIQYEPWHIRYVGLPHSAIMHEKNFALEEYLDYLKREKSISVNFNGKSYLVSYYPLSQLKDIKIPKDRHYEVSGDNMDGIIVTVFE